VDVGGDPIMVTMIVADMVDMAWKCMKVAKVGTCMAVKTVVDNHVRYLA
jgi:hypothetical protein